MFFTFPEDVRCTPSKRRAPQRRRDLALALIVARLLEDLKPGVVLEGVVTNVAAFGAFFDVGVRQDGLVHISAMANAFVRDPRKVCEAWRCGPCQSLGSRPDTSADLVDDAAR